jgi:O-methyltransferase
MISSTKNIIQKIFNLFNYELNQFSLNSLDLKNEEYKYIQKIINISNKFSMIGKKRMYFTAQAMLYAKNNKLQGDLVECGVWKGGTILLYKLFNDFYNLNKSIFAYDTFEGMGIPTKFDIDHQGFLASEQMKLTQKSEKLKNIHCFAEIENVKKNILKYSKLDNINFIKGQVENTLRLKKNLPKKISILRLDTDFYESTKIELEILYPRLVDGGVLIIDDYGHWKGCRKATDEFFNKKWLHVVDYSCRYIIKN